jgi:hypothetical protein
MKLSDEDGRAVDLLLDRKTISPIASGDFVESIGIEPQRVQTIQQILTALKQLPAEEPAADLASRTLRRVDAAIAALDAANPNPRPPPNDRAQPRGPMA